MLPELVFCKCIACCLCPVMDISVLQRISAGASVSLGVCTSMLSLLTVMMIGLFLLHQHLQTVEERPSPTKAGRMEGRWRWDGGSDLEEALLLCWETVT